jgi:hypothetical protein
MGNAKEKNSEATFVALCAECGEPIEDGEDVYMVYYGKRYHKECSPRRVKKEELK